MVYFSKKALGKTMLEVAQGVNLDDPQKDFMSFKNGTLTTLWWYCRGKYQLMLVMLVLHADDLLGVKTKFADLKS